MKKVDKAKEIRGTMMTESLALFSLNRGDSVEKLWLNLSH